MAVVSSRPKRKRTDCYQCKVEKPASVMVWGRVSAHGVGNTSVKAPLMLKATYRCWSNICCHPSVVFFRDVPASFSRTMQSHSLHVLQQRGFVVKEQPDLPPTENVWHIMKCNIRQQRPWTVEQLKLHMKQEWERIPTTQLQQLVSSVPSVVNRKGDITARPCPSFLGRVAGIKLKMSEDLQNSNKVYQFEHSIFCLLLCIQINISWKRFASYFVFIYVLHNIPTSLELGYNNQPVCASVSGPMESKMMTPTQSFKLEMSSSVRMNWHNLTAWLVCNHTCHRRGANTICSLLHCVYSDMQTCHFSSFLISCWLVRQLAEQTWFLHDGLTSLVNTCLKVDVELWSQLITF